MIKNLINRKKTIETQRLTEENELFDGPTLNAS